MRVLEYVEVTGRRPFARWFDALDQQAAAKVTVALARMGLGDFSNAKGLDEACSNIGSISDRDTEFISAVMRGRRDPAGRWHQEPAAAGYRSGPVKVGRLQETQKGAVTTWH